MQKEYRTGETIVGPLQLKSIWEPHVLRDFELRVIMQMAGCEHVVERLLKDEQLSPSERAPLDVANHIGKHKGYLPMFDMSREQPRISDGGEAVFMAFFESDVWTGRNPRQTRRT